MRRIAVGSSIALLLLLAGLRAMPLFPAKAQVLVATGLDRNGLSALGLQMMRTTEPAIARKRSL